MPTEYRFHGVGLSPQKRGEPTSPQIVIFVGVNRKYTVVPLKETDLLVIAEQAIHAYNLLQTIKARVPA